MTITAMTHYAVSERDGRRLTENELENYKAVSVSWQYLLGIRNESEKVEAAGGKPRVWPEKKKKRIEQITAEEEDEISATVKNQAISMPNILSTIGGGNEKSVQLLQLLRQPLNNKTARFYGVQAYFLQKVLLAEQDLLLVLPTGAGKSHFFQASSLYESSSHIYNVVVLPFVALLQQQFEKAQEKGIRASVFTESNKERLLGGGLLFVAVETFVTHSFQSFLGSMHQQGRIKRIFIDEAHVVKTQAGFRTTMLAMRRIRSVAIPIILLSATIPFSLENHLKVDFSAHLLHVLRLPTTRRDISFGLNIVDNNFEEAAKFIMARHNELTHGRGIVFAENIPVLEKFKNYMEINHSISSSTYTSRMQMEEKKEAVKNWQQGRSKIILATSAFGAGVDFSCVRFVIHLIIPNSLIEYAQEIGRGGRDGKGCEAVMFLTRSDINNFSTRIPIVDDGFLRETKAKLLEYVEETNIKCRRDFLTFYFDG